MLDNNLVGNGSSVFKVIGLLIAGLTVPILVGNGLNLNGEETKIIQIIGEIIAVTLSYVDMKYANSFFKKNITLEDYISYGQEHFGLTKIDNDSDSDA